MLVFIGRPRPAALRISQGPDNAGSLLELARDRAATTTAGGPSRDGWGCGIGPGPETGRPDEDTESLLFRHNTEAAS